MGRFIGNIPAQREEKAHVEVLRLLQHDCLSFVLSFAVGLCVIVISVNI